MRAAQPEALPIQGGTDLMVELNFDRRRPARMIDLNRVDELGAGRATAGPAPGRGRDLRPHRRRPRPLAPVLAIASRTVGSSQIRNPGTLGATWPPPRRPGRPAAPGRVRRRRRCCPRSGHAPDPDRRVLHRPQAQRPRARRAHHRRPPARRPGPAAVRSRWGPRNAMVIAVCSRSPWSLDPERTVRVGLGNSVGPAPPRDPGPRGRALPGGGGRASWACGSRAGRSTTPSRADPLRRAGAAGARPIDDVRAHGARTATLPSPCWPAEPWTADWAEHRDDPG